MGNGHLRMRRPPAKVVVVGGGFGGLYAALTLQKELARRGIELRLKTRVTAATEGEVELNGGEAIPARTLIWTGGATANPALARLPAARTRRGAVVVDEFLKIPEHPEVYVIGDNACVLDRRHNRPYPPVAPVAIHQGIRAAGNVTRFVTASGEAELLDFMPPYTASGATAGRYHPELYRGVRGLRGEVPFELACDPRPDYGRALPEVELTTRGAVIRGGGTSVALATNVPLRKSDRGIVGEWSVSGGTQRWLVLRYCSHAGCDADLLALENPHAEEQLRLTLDFWRRWADRCPYRGRWRDAVIRSALVIKLLTFGPTGALVAAPTTSLPETPGGPPGRDARYCWLRDAALALHALLRLGYTDEAQAFFRWLEALSLKEPEGLQALYGIDGRRELPEEILLHLDGYRGARPVRIGNAALTRRELDVPGELLNAFPLLTRQGKKLSGRTWAALRRLVDALCERWEAGSGTGVHSRLMAWVALDRAISLLDPMGQGVGFLTSLREGIRGLLTRERPVVERWTEVKEAIARDILLKGWNPRDASLLLLPTCQFLPAEDERVQTTVELARKEVTVGAPGSDAAIVLHSFWLADALAALGRTADAVQLFEGVLARASHLGLYPEAIDPTTGEFLGNFPRTLTHLGLIGSALTLEAQGAGGAVSTSTR